ncbi:ABC transporter ATP-binding protein [Lihuaxuella thermophila]|uniref:ATP-binding cassette, subfamily B, AbcA/BmrA n=1 Tax=Lihuaxuella thermophila TaxID=1173111 RepID=A0A1H8C3C2_9BACL|nr:ABC transporter ATP-binding protein [Lihuaxuella thermophila]SEM89585.1 ATP-binding cassette, subfamily B, AbcA/BmrA [Lihuaxuella thermophila]
MESEQTQTFQMNWRKFYQLVRQARLPKMVIVLAVGLSLLQTAAGLVVPWFTKDMVNVLSTARLDPGIILLLSAAFLLQAVAGGFSSYLLSYLGETVVANLRKRLWQKTLSLPVSYFDQNRSGDLISRVNNDTYMIKDVITNHLVSLFSSIVSVIGSLALLFYLDWSMTLVMLIAVPVLFLVIRPAGRRMYQISKNLQKETAEFTSLLAQVISEIRLVKAYTAEPIERENGERGIRHLFQFGLKEARVIAFLQPLMSLVMTGMLVVIIGFGGIRVATGALTAGELVAFILYLFQIIIPLSMMARFFTSLQKAMGATERLSQILEHEEEEQKETDLAVNPALPIIIDNVTFSYVTGEEVLRRLSFTIEPGKITAIVGPSGSGKTTLFSLLERFYEPTAGEIRQGEIPIRRFRLRDWRSQFGYVSQESPLMAGTIRENICYGMERDVSDEEIRKAAKLAFADEFIDKLPNGYDTEVGERGIKLSGGQRQRIAIARALLQNPGFLMLDEATSNLDSTSEKMVQEALSNLMKGRTTLVIAHRLSTVVDADKIVVIEKGQVTGEGTHHELLRHHQLYQQLVKQQFRWELEGNVANTDQTAKGLS